MLEAKLDARRIKRWPSAWQIAIRKYNTGEGANSMADNTAYANRFAREQQNRIIAVTAVGMNALKPILHFQVSMLRVWADSIERFAGNYEKGVKETATAMKEQSDEKRAAVTTY
jgi:hypothetical protein